MLDIVFNYINWKTFNLLYHGFDCASRNFALFKLFVNTATILFRLRSWIITSTLGAPGFRIVTAQLTDSGTMYRSHQQDKNSPSRFRHIDHSRSAKINTSTGIEQFQLLTHTVCTLNWLRHYTGVSAIDSDTTQSLQSHWSISTRQRFSWAPALQWFMRMYASCWKSSVTFTSVLRVWSSSGINSETE